MERSYYLAGLVKGRHELRVWRFLAERDRDTYLEWPPLHSSLFCGPLFKLDARSPLARRATRMGEKLGHWGPGTSVVISMDDEDLQLVPELSRGVNETPTP